MNSITEKICTKCWELKSVSEFSKHKGCKGGVNSVCRVCQKEYARQYYKANSEKVKQKVNEYRFANLEKVYAGIRRYVQNNKDKVLARRRIYQEKNTEKIKEYKQKWYIDNLESLKERYHKRYILKSDEDKARAKKWRSENLERVEFNKRKYYFENQEELRERSRQWRKNNPEKRRALNRLHRARKAGSGGKITVQEWEALKKFYNYTCLRCGKREPEIKLTLDHVLPLKLGGKHSIENAQPLCHSCNSSKNAKHVDYRKVK